MCEEMLKLGLLCPESQTNFVFVDLGDNTTNLFKELYDRGVVIRPMGQFGSSQNTYRISIGTPEENDRLIQAAKEVLG